MALNILYTNGVIAAKERYLLKDKIFRLCETNAEEALRTLTESGFGKGAEITSAYEYEQLVSADERAIDDFVREYSPSEAEKSYLLSPRDFHNAKALVKAHYLGLEPEKLLAPEGLIPVKVIEECIKECDYSPLGKYLGGATEECAKLFSEENSSASGAEIGAIFEKAQFSHLLQACRMNALLKKLLAVKADMTNILSYLRSSEREYAEKLFVSGGKLTKKQLSGLFDEDREKAEKSLNGTPYADFAKKCYEDRLSGLPLTDAERVFESYETEYFSKNRYTLEKNQAFLYYVFRRRAENANVRILFACLLANMKDYEIKNRLRTVF